MPRAEDREGSADVAALIALLRAGSRPPAHYADLMAQGRTAIDLLEEEQGLLARQLASDAGTDLVRWREQGLNLLTPFDQEYPENLRAVHDRPPLIFVRGALTAGDERAVAVIGSRQASAAGVARARAITGELIAHGFTVVSGLALGIDTAAHTAALEGNARTLAVIGTGVNRCYPAENASLQRRIASSGAVISQFWPDDGPRRENFPLRNALMSGLSLATVIVEASHRSGARIQARCALAHGRPVLLTHSLLDQPWAGQLADRSGVHVVRSPAEVVEVVEQVSSTEAPSG
jgi:DNA processing protein